MGHPNDNDHQLSVFVTIGLNELHTRLLVENDAKAALGTSRIFSTQDKQDYLKIMQRLKEYLYLHMMKMNKLTYNIRYN